VLADRTSGSLLCDLSCGAASATDPRGPRLDVWLAVPATPPAWRQAFPQAPQVIAERPASVGPHPFRAKEPENSCSRSSSGFSGYRIGELYPRRTRAGHRRELAAGPPGGAGRSPAGAGADAAAVGAARDPLAGHPGDLPIR
jgi:hypothetical protein